MIKRAINRFLRRMGGVPLHSPKSRDLFYLSGIDELPRVTPMQALGIPALLTVIDAKARDIAMLPRHLYKKTNKGRDTVLNHDQLALIKTSPNGFVSAFNFWRAMLTTLYLNGNAYAIKNTNRHGRATSYRYIHPHNVIIHFDPDEDILLYEIDDEIYTPDQIIHLRDISFNGVHGHSRITLAQIAFQKGYSLEKFSADLFHNRTNLTGWIGIEDWMDDEEQIQLLKDSWNAKYRGIGKDDVAVLQGGSKYHQLTMKLTDAQFIENQKMSVKQIAMLYGVPLSRLGDTDDANRANMESSFKQYAIFGLQAELIQIEQELDLKTLRPSERGTYFWKINMKGLLRGDTASQGEFYKTMINFGIMTPNEIRALEELNPLEEGDRVYVPLNMIPADRVDDYVDSIAAKGMEKAKENEDKSFFQNGNEAGEHPPAFYPNGNQVH